ncbi:FAD-linked oxidase [Catellatospora methionotrophica]|uniref:FAD-linked oxidase n=1 Tax=Catellatospora methionotrophica TaxID=121620 RepID=A0A8J3LBG6_9ACTN|nr:BBE domain-containing protein [Catellatospora methionotrophica]GIG15299.1 FAD-linked oxidase [Catellatospora methionotrophica]
MPDALILGPDDPAYATVVRGINRRFVGEPNRVHRVTGTEQVVAAVAEAVRDGRRLAVRGGGHCYEGFVADPEVDVLIDMSGLDAVGWDETRQAYAVGAGAGLGAVYKALFKNWGVTIPGGSCHSVGVGGHFTGGGYGVLSRRHGLTVDHLYAVEVVVVGEDGQVRAVVATRDPADPHHDLWWAHTGGGGGTFGVVTRFWLRSPGGGPDPATALPTPPAEVWLHAVTWPWASLDRDGFDRLLTNFGDWHERHATAADPYAGLAAALLVQARAADGISLRTTMDATAPDTEGLLRAFVAEIGAGVGAAGPMTQDSGKVAAPPDATAPRKLRWLWANQLAAGSDLERRAKYKSAFLRRGFTARQRAAIWASLDHPHTDAVLQLDSFGGAINEVAAEATAYPHRDSVLKAQWQVYWTDPADDDRHLAWIRQAYRAVFADRGGVPVADDQLDGCYVNYPDVDLSDPGWNTSGTPWTELYFGLNYARLQQVKARWDPTDTFRHAQSVRLP